MSDPEAELNLCQGWRRKVGTGVRPVLPCGRGGRPLQTSYPAPDILQHAEHAEDELLSRDEQRKQGRQKKHVQT